jgi:hypothetical protein
MAIKHLSTDQLMTRIDQKNDKIADIDNQIAELEAYRRMIATTVHDMLAEIKRRNNN